MEVLQEERVSGQVHCAITKLRDVCGLCFGSLISGQLINGCLSDLGFAFRKRIYTPTTTIWIFLTQVLSCDKSCSHAVAQFLAHRIANGLSPCSSESTSYCEARSRLPLELFSELLKTTGQTDGHSQEDDDFQVE